mgnify:CR=1 FL=1
MTTSQDHLNNKNISKKTDNKDDFAQVVFDGRNLLKNKKEFQNEEWKWATELDDDGMFIFSYLLYDFNQHVLRLNRLKETVYMLNLLRKKMLPGQDKTGLSQLDEFQLIFTLYERLKLENMSWEDCEKYLKDQIMMILKTN